LCAGFENVFDQPLIGTGKPTDAPPALGWQKLSLVEECPDIGATVIERRQVRLDNPRELLARSAGCPGNGNGLFEKSLDPAKAHFFEGDLFGWEIVIEASLANSQDISDVLSRGAVKATIGEHLRGGVHDGRAAAPRLPDIPATGIGGSASAGSHCL